MRTSWRVFKIFGIDIRIDSSWIFIFGLITWPLPGTTSPASIHDGLTGSTGGWG